MAGEYGGSDSQPTNQPTEVAVHIRRINRPNHWPSYLTNDEGQGRRCGFAHASTLTIASAMPSSTGTGNANSIVQCSPPQPTLERLP